MTLPAVCRILLVLALLVGGSKLTSQDPVYTVIHLDSRGGNDSSACLHSPTQPCKTLDYAMTTSTAVSLHLRVHPGMYSYGEGLELKTGPGEANYNLLIEKISDEPGEAIFHCSSFSNDTFNNLAILGSENVTVIGITFERCGSISAGIYTESVEYVTLRECTFRNNINAGATLYNCLNVLVSNCTFAGNYGLRTGQYSTVNALSQRTYSTSGLALILYDTSCARATISDCVFTNNSAYVIDVDSPLPSTYSLVGHGGAMLIRFAYYSNNNFVSILRCSFRGNNADFTGGSLYFPFFEQVANNTVEIDSCMFEGSVSKGSGGAVSVHFFDIQVGQKIVFRNTVFRGNSALYGGGALSLVLEDSLIPLSVANPNITELINVTFDGNTSPTGGSAIGLVSNARVGQSSSSITVTVTDCKLVRNSASNQSAIFSFRFPLSFEGHNTFSENGGGAITLIQAQLNVKGTLSIINNTAIEGAGIIVEDSSVIYLLENTTLLFVGNRASTVGGALLVHNPNLVYRDDSVIGLSMCFIDYDTDGENRTSYSPINWKGVSVIFDENTVEEAGAAIYASDIGVCTYIPDESVCIVEGSDEYRKSIFQQVPFSFSNDTNRVVPSSDQSGDELVPEVGTDPARIIVIPLTSNVSPGDNFRFTIESRDQSGNYRSALWSIENIENTNGGELQYYGLSAIRETRVMPLHLEEFNVNINPSVCENMSGLLPDVLSVLEFEFFVIQPITGDIANDTHVLINVTCCHPGYSYNSTMETCLLQSGYPHFLRKNLNNSYVYLQPGYYAGFYDDTQLGEQYFTTALIPSAFQHCTEEGSRTGCLYAYDRPDDQCGDDRTGYLCGQCPEGMGVDLTLRKCKKCTAADAVGFVVIGMLIVFCSVLVLVFNIGIPNELVGFLFFAQVVGFVYQQGAEQGSWDYHLSRLLGFSIYLPICPFTALPALWTTAFGLYPSILATATVIIYIISARFIRKLSQRSSFRGQWLIVLFVYKYTADTAFNMVKCVQLEGSAVDSKYFVKLVFFFDGTVPCFAGSHLIVAVPSLLLIIIVLLVPAFVLLISFRRFKTTQPFTDVITEGIKPRFRWWSAFDVFRRLLFVIVVTVFDFVLPEYVLLLLVFATVLIIGVLCAAQPYKKQYVNIIEAAILLDLLLLSINFLDEEGNRTSSDSIASLLLLLVPFLYALANICVRMVQWLWMKYIPMSLLKVPEMIIGKFSKGGHKQFNLKQKEGIDVTSYNVTDDHSYSSSEFHKDPIEADYSQFRDDILDTMEK